MPFEICKPELCSGCGACLNVCPKNCINLIEKDYGCRYPQITVSLCIDCKLCQKVCPNNRIIERSVPQQAYAAWSSNNRDRLSSSSGGGASVFSSQMILNGGVVVGAAMGEDAQVSHRMAINEAECSAFKDSKYVQSDIGHTFLDAKKQLENQIPVLFIGLPCQIAGLKGYLQKTYDNLLTCDLICHGVPPQKLLREHLSNICEELSKMNVSFRSPNGFTLKINKAGKNIYNRIFYKDLYYLGFMKSLFYRESCYQCPYATKERVSDITIGDFWGLGKKVPFEAGTEGGVSLILPNTDKGLSFIKSCSDLLHLYPRPLEEAITGNPQLRTPSKAHKNREKFIALYPKIGFKKAATRCLWQDIIKYRILYILMNFSSIKQLIQRIKD